jgi:REP element-mobilizing transposase RayT
MVRRRVKQLELQLPCTWGGKRSGAGRKPKAARPGQSHRPRTRHDARQPVHVTLRARRGLPSLRSEAISSVLRDALARSNRADFRILHFSIQSDHLHVIVEADSANVRRRGIWGLAVRLAKAVNRRAGRTGSVWSDRYHARALTTPREVRRAMAYVLLNFCKHLRAPAAIDPRSSGPWFEGWAERPRTPKHPRPVASAKTWLATVGWRRAGGPIGFDEAPRPNLIER